MYCPQIVANPPKSLQFQSLQIQMNSCDFFTNSYNITRILMHPYLSSLIFINSCNFSLILTNFCESSQILEIFIFTYPHEFLWFLRNSQKFMWIRINSHESMWIPMYLYKSLEPIWILMCPKQRTPVAPQDDCHHNSFKITWNFSCRLILIFDSDMPVYVLLTIVTIKFFKENMFLWPNRHKCQE